MALGVERRLADAAREMYERPERELFPAARRHIVDCAGVALAGASARSVAALHATMPMMQGEGSARLLGTGRRLSPRDAATVNGTAAHFHDYDDDDPALSVGHPTSPVFGALCAIADVTPASIDRVIAAYLAGVETTMRVGRIVNPAHYNAGWHATATLGIFGATVAAALLLDLDGERIEHALGIAASLSSGLKCNFGSDVKPLQAGTAAGNGVWAAQLASGGVRGATGALFGHSGFCRVYGGKGNAQDVVDSFGRPHGLASPGLNIKLYPCCSSTHTAVDALLQILQSQRLSSLEIEAVDAWIGPDVPAILIYDVPRDPLEAKFSLRYCLAAAAHFGELGLQAFTIEAVESPSIAALMDRISVHVDASLPAIPTGVTHRSRVRLVTRNGVGTTREIAEPLGSAARPVPESDLRQKFVRCAAPALGASGGEGAFDAWLTLPGHALFASWLDRLCEPQSR